MRGDRVCLCNVVAQPTLVQRVIEAQRQDPEMERIRAEITSGAGPKDWSVRADGSIRFLGRLCVPEDAQFREDVLRDAHRSRYTIHPGGTKMYRDLKRHFWWSGMKSDVAQFVARSLTCQQVKAEHQRPAGLLQPLPVAEWKWDHVTMDCVTGLPKTEQGFNGVWVIVDRLTKSAHFLLIRTTSPH